MGLLSKWLIIGGVCLILAGLLLWATSKVGIPLGKLPGDFHWKWGTTTLYFPLATTVILSLLLNLILYWIRK